MVTGVISRSKNPLAMAFSARFWLLDAPLVLRSRVIPSDVATFSAVWPMAM